jgi:hypothetical protein
MRPVAFRALASGRAGIRRCPAPNPAESTTVEISSFASLRRIPIGPPSWFRSRKHILSCPREHWSEAFSSCAPSQPASPEIRLPSTKRKKKHESRILSFRFELKNVLLSFSLLRKASPALATSMIHWGGRRYRKSNRHSEGVPKMADRHETRICPTGCHPVIFRTCLSTGVGKLPATGLPGNSSEAFIPRCPKEESSILSPSALIPGTCTIAARAVGTS